MLRAVRLDKNEYRTKAGCASGGRNFGYRAKQCSATIVGRSSLVIPRGVNARRAAQCIHLQSRVIRQHTHCAM